MPMACLLAASGINAEGPGDLCEQGMLSESSLRPSEPHLRFCTGTVVTVDDASKLISTSKHFCEIA